MHARWWMLALLFSAAVINYLDRQSLSVAAPVVRKQFHMSNTDYAWMVFAFLLAYTFLHPLAGRIIDRLGTRKGFSLAMAAWSLASMGQAAATGVLSFCAIRFLLGAGEAALLPASVKAASEWFPPAQRSLAVGFTIAGMGAGAILASPLMAWLILKFDWRVAFLLTGASGFAWLAAWSLFHRWPARDTAPALSGEADRQEAPVGWLALLRNRQVIGLMLARFIADSAWYFYLFWLPEYLSQVRGFSLQQIGSWAWIPYLTANAGSILGGFLTGYLLHRGWSLNGARKTVMMASAALMPLAMKAAFVPEPASAIAIISLATFLIQVWAANLFTLPADLFPPRLVASVYGLSGAAGSGSAMLFMLVVGVVVDRFSYTPILISVALMQPLAALVILWTIPRIEMLREFAARGSEN